MVKFPSIFHGARLERTELGLAPPYGTNTELAYHYMGKAKIVLTRDTMGVWGVEASLEVLNEHDPVYPGARVYKSPPLPEAQVLDVLESSYQWLRTSLEEEVKLAERLLQEDLEAQREASSRLEEFKKGHPPTLWERLHA